MSAQEGANTNEQLRTRGCAVCWGRKADNQASRGMTQQPLHAVHQNPWQPVWWGHARRKKGCEFREWPVLLS